jgi:hypothetical protein
VQFAGFHLRGRRRAIGNHTPDDAIEIRCVRPPVVGIAVGDNILPAFIFDELERSGAHGSEVVWVLPDVAILVQVLRRNIAQVRQGAQQQVERHRPLIAKHGCQRIWRIDRGEKELQRRAVVENLLPHLHGGEFDIRRGEGFAVVPSNAFAQLERDGLAVG